MAIYSTYTKGCSTKLEPQISFPFLYRNPQSGNIWFRFSRHNASTTYETIIHERGGPLVAPLNMTTGMSDEQAWSNRLAPDHMVTLRNND